MRDYLSQLKEKLTFKYRLVIIDDDTFEEQFSFKLSRLNVYVFGGVFIILLILITSLVIAYTPLREYVPGYASTEVKQKAQVLMDSLDVMYQKNVQQEAKMKAVMAVLTGNIKVEEYKTNVDSLVKANKDSIKNHQIYASKKDSLFRLEVENQDKFNINPAIKSKNSLVFFAPVSGPITKEYDLRKQNFGIDIATTKGTPVKSIEDGTVIFAEWSVDTGFVIIVNHGKNVISVYKHNATLLKKQGDLVKTGEIIATTGSEHKFTNTTHLHFELWYNGYPVDPKKFIHFE